MSLPYSFQNSIASIKVEREHYDLSFCNIQESYTVIGARPMVLQKQMEFDYNWAQCIE